MLIFNHILVTLHLKPAWHSVCIWRTLIHRVIFPKIVLFKNVSHIFTRWIIHYFSRLIKAALFYSEWVLFRKLLSHLPLWILFECKRSIQTLIWINFSLDSLPLSPCTQFGMKLQILICQNESILRSLLTAFACGIN